MGKLMSRFGTRRALGSVRDDLPVRPAMRWPLTEGAAGRHTLGQPSREHRIYPLANEELGTKRDCPNCGARFYDLKQDPAHCPKCDEEFTPEALLKPRRQRGDDAAAKAKASEEKEVDEDEDEDDEDEIPADERETSLDEADETGTPAKSKKRKSLDDDDDDTDDDDDDEPDPVEAEIAEIELDDEDDDTLIDDDDDESNPLEGVVTNNAEEEER